MNVRHGAWLVAALLATSCTLAPASAPTATGSLTLRLADLFPAERQTQVLLATSQARVTVSGPGITKPLTVTVPVTGTSLQANLTGIPAGPNRLIELVSLDDQGMAVPGARFRTTASLQQGSNTATLSAATTPRGDVFAALLASGSPLASTLDASRLQERIEALYRTLHVPHFGLIDGEKIAQTLVANGGNLDALAVDNPSFAQTSASLRVTVSGLPDNLPAEVWLDDPVSPKQSSVLDGNLTIAPIKPGSWNLYARAGSMRLGPVPVTPGPGVVKHLDFSRSTQLLAPLPAARGAAASGVLTMDLGDGPKAWLVVAGGITGSPFSGPTESVVAFDGQTWRTLSDLDMPHAVSHAAFTVHDNQLWVLGGISGGAATTSVQVFDADQKAWRSEEELPEPSAMGSVGIAGGQIVLSPGVTSWSYDLFMRRYVFDIPSSVLIRDLSGGDWAPATSLTPARLGAATVTHQGRIYFIGGHVNGTMATNPVLTVNVYDPPTMTMSAVAPIPTPRLAATAWVHQGKIVVAGGITGLGKPLSNVEAYDLARDRWEILPSLPTPRGHAASGILDGKALIVGGHDNPFYASFLSPLDLVEALTP
ncbi:N-acetylneuraminate epimerase [compost metagenome]